MKRPIYLIVSATAILAAFAWWRSIPTQAAGIPKQEKPTPPPAQSQARELPYQRLHEISAWLKAGGGADTDALKDEANHWRATLGQ